MRIENSIVGMESARTSTNLTKMSFVRSARRAKEGNNKEQDLFGNLLGGQEEKSEVAESVEQQDEEDGNLQNITDQFKTLTNVGKIPQARVEETNLQEIRQRCILYLLALLFPELRGEKELTTEGGFLIPEQSQWGTGMGKTIATNFRCVTRYYHEETETTSFQTTGMVKTADGREISFGLELEMSRSFAEYYEQRVDYTQISYCDPLVINLDHTAANLSDQKFFFDLDSDGTEEKIARLCEGSGYLALDLNGNGTIDDGSELFGTKSGDGFADLAKYDEDGNGWIDENDSIWEKLQIWCQREDGESELYTLREKGVGALYLGRSKGDFMLTDSDALHAKGAVRSTGFFLYENGLTGTLQQLDLAT